MLVGSVVVEKWNSQSVDSPRIARAAVWQRRGTRGRDLMARSAESASDWL